MPQSGDGEHRTATAARARAAGSALLGVAATLAALAGPQRLAIAAEQPAVRVEVALDPDNWDTRDAGLAVAGAGTAAEPTTAQIESRLAAAMSEGFLADAYRRRRAYPVLDLAERDVRRGDLTAAITGYERYLKEDPRHLVIRWRLVQLLRSVRRSAEVAENAGKLLDAVPDFGPALVQKGQALASLGQPGPAMDAFVKALRLPGLPPSGRRDALGGLVNVAVASGRLAEADSQLAAEQPGPPGSAAARGLLAARASLAERAGRAIEAAAFWGRIAATAPAPERRRALLAQAQLLDWGGQAADGLGLLRSGPIVTLFAADGGAPPATRLRYQRLVSVLAEQTGETAIAAEAAAEAAALQREAQAADAGGGLTDRMRAARLEQRRAGGRPAAVLAFLSEDGQPLERPADAGDAAWTDYLFLLADAAQRAARPALVDAALDRVPTAALGDWRTAARAAEIADRAGHPAQAAALWARVAATAPDDARRRALLAQALLLERSGSSAEAFGVLDLPATRALFAEDASTSAERLRYERTFSVLAERVGRMDLARAASERAALLEAPGAAISLGALLDRQRAVRLQTARDAPSSAALTLLLDQNGHSFARPEDADDALWTEYGLLLADTAQRARRPALAREALDAIPLPSLHDWRQAAQFGELALAAGRPALAFAALRPWNAQTLPPAGADRTATLAVLTLRANAAAAANDRAAEGVTASEIAAIDPRIGNAPDRAQRLLDTHDTAAAITLLEGARGAIEARAAEAPAGERPAARHRLAQLLVTLGNARWQAGETTGALRAFREGLAAAESWPVRWQLAEMLRRAGQRQEAAAEYRRAAQTAPTPADAQLAWLTLGDLLFASKAYTAAYEAFRSGVAAGAGPAGRLRLADAADRRGRYADEARALEPLAGSLMGRERLCQVLIKAGERDAASACLDHLAAMAAGDAAAWRIAADVAGALGRAGDRTRYLETAFRLSPRPDLGLAAGDALLAAGRPADAAAMFGAVAGQSGDPLALIAQGEALAAAHQPSAAAEALASALATPALPAPLQARAYAALGYAQDADGDPVAAAASWQRALQLGADPGLAISRGDALLRAGRANEAAAALAAAGGSPSDAARSRRDSLEVRLALARGDPSAARTAAEALARAQPTPANLSLLAQARSAAGDDRGAVAASEQAADAAPGDAQVQAQAGYAALAAGAPATAAQRFEKALAREPDRLPLRQDLPRAYVRAGDWPDARRAYADAIERTTAHAAATGAARDQRTLQDLRGENAAATREFAFELVDTLCAPSGAVGCGLALPIVERFGSAGIGAVTAAWSPHIPGDSNPQRVAVYARLLWSNQPGGVSVLGRTLQGGVGVRVQPLSGIPVFLWAERLFAVGRQSQDNWLLRVTAGWETGANWRPGGSSGWREDWNRYAFIYGDLGHFFIRDQDWLGVAEGRVGATHQPFDWAMLVPYLFVRGELDSARRSTETDVQAGAGVSLRMRLLHDALLGYQLEPDLFLRVAHDLHRSSGQRATRFLFGVITRF